MSPDRLHLKIVGPIWIGVVLVRRSHQHRNFGGTRACNREDPRLSVNRAHRVDKQFGTRPGNSSNVIRYMNEVVAVPADEELFEAALAQRSQGNSARPVWLRRVDPGLFERWESFLCQSRP